MKQLNKSQQKILEFLKQRTVDGIPPSVREICAATGLKSTSTVHTYLGVLEEHGYITRNAGLNRAIRVNGAEQSLPVPIIGTVTAGNPILAFENPTGYIPFSAARAAGKELFALKIKGDSMTGAGIMDGDIVVTEKTPVANNGEIVVALMDDEATVKRFYRKDDGFVLMPENPEFKPIEAKEVVILGKVIACMRTY